MSAAAGGDSEGPDQARPAYPTSRNPETAADRRPLKPLLPSSGPSGAGGIPRRPHPYQRITNHERGSSNWVYTKVVKLGVH